MARRGGRWRVSAKKRAQRPNRATHLRCTPRARYAGCSMIFIHETHEVAGGKMEEFGDALRTRWRPLLEERGDARLLWFWELAHGTGASYQAVSITAVRDWAAWGALVARTAHDPRARDWQRHAWTLRREVTAKVLLPTPWSPLQEVDLGVAPVET